MKRILILICLLLPALSLAQDRKPLQLDVSGEIAIDHQGAVYDYKIHTLLAPEVKKIVEDSVRHWRFEPVLRDGKPVYAKSGIHLTLSALPVETGYRLRIDKVRFVGHRAATKMVPPEYPMDAKRAAIGARILVAVRIDAQGKVLDAVAVQSVVTNTRRPNRSADQFEKASVAAMKQWLFQPANIEAGDSAETTLIVPIEYSVDWRTAGSWRDSNPGQSRPIPWLPADKQEFDAAGLKSGQSLALDNPLRPKEAIEGKTL